jgi:hypothetical protein
MTRAFQRSFLDPARFRVREILMQQRQLRLGDILDDYCPRERRVTNHAVVAMVGPDVKQTRCTTCDSEHEYKHARIPRKRKKGDTTPALYAQVAAGAPKRVAHEESRNGGAASDELDSTAAIDANAVAEPEPQSVPMQNSEPNDTDSDHVVERTAAAEDVAVPNNSADEELSGEEPPDDGNQDEGPIHRRLIRASLPRPEGQQPPARPIPEFTIRQPGGGRQNRFRARHRGQQGHQFHGGNRTGGNPGGNSPRGPRPGGGGRPGMPKRHGDPHGRKRSK